MDCQPFGLNYDLSAVPKSQVYVAMAGPILGVCLTPDCPLSTVIFLFADPPDARLPVVARNLFFF